jgi:predicted phosphodiesterase
MRLRLLSDLHLEFGTLDLPPAPADVVVLAGDIHVGTHGLTWMQSQFPGQPVLYVPGNHEYYHHRLPELTAQLRSEADGTNVQVLENSSFDLNGVRFLGCTLWTDFMLGIDPEAAMNYAERAMNDFCLIHRSPTGAPLRARDTWHLHAHSVAWLAQELSRHDPVRTVVITHHAPSARSEAPFHAGSPLTPAFASDLDGLVEGRGPALWIHGHTHYNVDYRLGPTRILTNQRGYPSQVCAGFDPGLVVEI